MDLGLRGKVVLITGGSAGIGFAAAEQFAREGASVGIVARDRGLLDTAGRALSTIPGAGSVVALSGDLSDPEVPERIVQEVEGSLGKIDVLVNNVGVAKQVLFHELRDRDWEASFQLNLMSYVRCIQAVLPSMRSRRAGCIVNVSSSAGKRPSTGMADYSVMKAAVLSLSRLVADTYASDGIRSLAICPGPANTPAWLEVDGLADQVAERKGITREEALEATGKGRPIGRMAEPEEIASAIVFAASPTRASYLTGAALSIDGGSVPSIV
jgi:3-oxoacyl-[acyl-carrier protein] reductase